MGFITSLVIMMLMSTMTILLMKGLFDHTQAYVVSKMEFSVSPRDYYLNANNFQIAVNIQDKRNGLIINTPQKKYFNITVDFLWLIQEVINGTLTPKLIRNQGTLRQCTSDDATYVQYLNLQIQQGIETKLLNKLYCLDKQTFQNASLAVGGDNTQSHIRFVRVQILKCINNPECAPLNEVENILSGAKVNIGFNDFYLDSTQYEKPLQKVMRVKQFGINVDSITRTLMWLRRISVQTDENFFLMNNKRNIQEAMQYQNYETTYNQPINNSLSMPSLYDFIFQIQQQEEFTYRTYGNILEVMAYVGGFYRFLTFIASIFVNPLVKKHYMGSLAFDINKDISQSEKIFKQYYQPQPRSPITLEKQTKNSVMDKLRFLREQNRLDDLIKQNDILKCMDITRMIKISQDIHRLKSILFTKEQKLLLELMPVPLNFENEENFNDINVEQSVKFVNSQDNFINYNLKQILFKDLPEQSPFDVEMGDIEKKYSIIPDEIKSSRDVQDYQIVINNKFSSRLKQQQT